MRHSLKTSPLNRDILLRRMYSLPGIKIANLFCNHLLNTVKTCKGNVFFRTKEGDSLNLNSLLSQFIFTSIVCDEHFLASGEIYCENAEDYHTLENYLADAAPSGN